MNYRHDFHAGNFADVFKHVVLTRVLLYLQRKPAPYRFIDTHAGAGHTDLAGDAPGRTQEWRGGIGRLEPDAFGEEARALIAPYLDLVGAAAEGRAPYPGSPAIALALGRPFDRMIFCELHPAAAAGLKVCVGTDHRAKAIRIDGYTGLRAYIPPVERRGVILIDPPFEAEDEFERLAAAVVAAHAKWREGVILAWHPVKDRRGPEHVATCLRAAGIEDMLRLEFAIDAPAKDGRLVANGLFVINPPYTLEGEMACLLPELCAQLGTGRAQARVDRLTGG